MKLALIAFLVSGLQAELDVITDFASDTSAGVVCQAPNGDSTLCTDPTASGYTIFTDLTVSRDWTTPLLTDYIMAGTNDGTVPTDACAATDGTCFNHPWFADATAKAVQAAPDGVTWGDVTTYVVPGVCLVNFIIGDAPWAWVNANPLGTGGGKYTVAKSAAASLQECQSTCVKNDACVFYTYVTNPTAAQAAGTETCYLQSKEALESLYYPADNGGCGFDHGDTIINQWANCSDTATGHPKEKLCAIYSAYALTGMKLCDPAATPTLTWMQTNSMCNADNTFSTTPAPTTYTGTTVTAAGTNPATGDATATTPTDESGVAANVVLTSMAALVAAISVMFA